MGDGGTLIAWDDHYLTGITEIDNQHKHLVNTINLLAAAVRLGKAPLILSETIQTLSEYGVFHFSEEETLMTSVEIPEAIHQAHLREHDLYIRKVSEITRMFSEKPEETARELVDYMSVWWDRHILVSDMKYKEFLK